MEIRLSKDEDLAQIFNLRFKVLRKPFGQLKGSEVLDDESTCTQVVCTIDSKVIGVARMHVTAENEGHVRCVCVDTAS
jgi:N-acetylglutamate synthase-like GNAT family acetyltransferase